jgi:hypothetical protein
MVRNAARDRQLTRRPWAEAMLFLPNQVPRSFSQKAVSQLADAVTPVQRS